MAQWWVGVYRKEGRGDDRFGYGFLRNLVLKVSERTGLRDGFISFK